MLGVFAPEADDEPLSGCCDEATGELYVGLRQNILVFDAKYQQIRTIDTSVGRTYPCAMLVDQRNRCQQYHVHRDDAARHGSL